MITTLCPKLVVATTCALALGCGAAKPETPPEYPPLTAEGAAPPAPAAPATGAAATPPAAAPPAAAPAPVPPRPAVPIEVPPAIAKLIAAKDRTEADQKLDAGRHPGETLAFFGVAPGMKVAEIGAGSGYTAELLARAVGKQGKVFAVNSPWLLEKFAAKPWTERMARPAMKNVVRVDRAFGDPLPPEAKDLDAVFVVLLYHDLVWMEGVDRAAMNAAIFKALKPGGTYGIIDHSGRPGTGTSEVLSLHRIEESVVRQEIEAAGFKLAAEGDFLRNPADTRDWNDAPNAAAERRGTSDRFALKYVKP